MRNRKDIKFYTSSIFHLVANFLTMVIVITSVMSSLLFMIAYLIFQLNILGVHIVKYVVALYLKWVYY